MASIISKIWPKFQVISSLFEVNELLDEHWAKIVLSKHISTPIYAIKCIDQRFAFKNSHISVWPWYSSWKFNYYSPVCQKISCRWRNIMSHIQFFFSRLIWSHGLVVKTGCRESCDMGSIPDDCWNPLQCLCHFVWHWAHQCTDTRASYIAVLFLGFRQSRADKVVNLNTTIQLALFWRTQTWALASTCPHVLAWHMDRDYSYCRASELTDRQVSGFVFSWFLENTEKTKAS